MHQIKTEMGALLTSIQKESQRIQKQKEELQKVLIEDDSLSKEEGEDNQYTSSEEETES